MKAKIWVAIAAGIIFTACETRVAAEDKIFTSSGQIVDGEEWNNVSIYNDDTIVDMLGGLVDRMGTYDASTLNVTGGYVSTLEAHEFSTANVSGGYVYGVFASDNAILNFSGDASAVRLGVGGDLGTINMTGGTTHYLGGGDSSTTNLYGGIISENLGAVDSAVVNVYGYGFEFDPNGGSRDGGQLTGFWLDDSAFIIDLYGAETYSHINLIPVVDVEVDIRPAAVNLRSRGKWISCEIRFGEDCNAADVNSGTVLLEDEVPAEWIWFNEQQNVVMVKFSRSEVQQILEVGNVELTVRGYLTDGSYFVGTDAVKVIGKGRRKD
jgi:hypothetical protein